MVANNAFSIAALSIVVISTTNISSAKRGYSSPFPCANIVYNL